MSIEKMEAAAKRLNELLYDFYGPNHSHIGLVDIKAVMEIMQPKFTDVVPTEPGWYWWRASPTSRNDPFMRKVYCEKWMMHSDGQPTLTAKVKGQWSGPIQPPEGS